MNAQQQLETVIVGAGQAGLAAGYHLKKRGRPFLILDANERVGDAWRNRWDSLRLFTPARTTDCRACVFPRAGGRSHEGRDGATTSRRTRRGSSCPFARASPSSASPSDGERFVVSRRRHGSRPTTWSSRRVRTGSRRFPRSLASSTRASRSCTPASTAIRRSCARAGVLVVGRATPEPRSPSSSRERTRSGRPASREARSRSATGASGAARRCRSSGSSATTC